MRPTARKTWSGVGKDLRKPHLSRKLVVAGDDLFVVGEVVAVAAVFFVGLGDLVDHEAVDVGAWRSLPSRRTR